MLLTSFIVRVCLTGFFCAVLATSAPVIAPSGGVVSAASLTPGGGIAPGSYILVQGTDLGPAAGIAAPPASDSSPYPTELPASNGTSVTISAAGVNYSAFIVYASATEVLAILPSTVPAGSAGVSVTFAGTSSQRQTITIASEQFGVFAENGQGWGQASVTGNNIAQPIAPGSTVILYGTGLGALAAGTPDNEPSSAVNFLEAPYGYTVSVNIGGQSVPAAFAGRAGSWPALDEIEFQLPSAVSNGCFVRGEVVVSAPAPLPAALNGVRRRDLSIAATTTTSNPFTLAIASPGEACSNAFGLPQAALQKLQDGGTVNIGLGWFSSANDINSVGAVIGGFLGGRDISPATSEAAEGQANVTFFTANKAAVAGLNSIFTLFFTLGSSSGVFDPSLLPPAGQCGNYDFQTLSALPPNGIETIQQIGLSMVTNVSLNQIFPGATLAALPAGAELGLSGSGASLTLAPNDSGLVADSSYSADVADEFFIAGGTWTLDVPGAPDSVSAFSQSFTMPSTLIWTNAPADGSIPSGQNLQVDWTGGSGGQAVIFGYALNSSFTGAAFVCAPSASAQQFTVPQAALQGVMAVSGSAASAMEVVSTGAVALQGIKGLDGGELLSSGGSNTNVIWGGEAFADSPKR